MTEQDYWNENLNLGTLNGYYQAECPLCHGYARSLVSIREAIRLLIHVGDCVE